MSFSVARWRSNLRRFIIDCIERGGVPIFRTRYGGLMLCRGNVCRVIAVCWGAGRHTGHSIEVPKWIAEELDRRRGDFLYLSNVLGIDLEKLLRSITS